MEKTNLMITGCGGHFMNDTVECFRNQEIEFNIIAVASQPDPFIAPLVDQYIQVPTSDHPDFVDIILTLCKKHRVDVIIPTIDDELYPMWLRREEFAAIGTKVSVDKASLYGSDKVAFAQKLRELGLPYPKFEVIHNTEECIKAAQKMGYPHKSLCVKLPNKAGSRGVRILAEDAFNYDTFANQKPSTKAIDLAAFVSILIGKKDNAPILMQEFLPGDEYSVDLLADHGKVLCATGRRNVAIDNSIPMESVLEWNEDAIETCRQFIEKCGLDGNIGFDFIFNENGRAIPIELNARLTATISLSAWGGCNMAYWQVLRLLGKELPSIPTPEEGKRIIRRLFPVFVDKDGKVGTFHG